MTQVLWVTNVAAPYRLPVWRYLGAKSSLTVGLLESTRRLARDGGQNRGADWQVSANEPFHSLEYRSVCVRRGEERHYGLVDPRAWRDVRRSDVVLLGGWDSPAYWQLLGQAKAMGVATVGFYESTLASRAHQGGAIGQARERFYNALDRIVVPGVAAGESVRSMGVAPEKIHVGFNAVNSAAFSAVTSAAPHEGHHYLYVGQFIERKNIDAILTSFAEIAHGEDRLTLVGKGNRKPVLEELASELGIRDQVEFINHVPNEELPALMARHDTLVLCSHVEVWGLVVNEALASGMQVVVTANCGVAPSVEGMPGVLLARPDAGDLADGMAKARDEFRGRISDPPILQHTPETFAEVFLDAFGHAIADRRKA